METVGTPKKHFLILDDDSAIGRLLVRGLSSLGHTADWTSDPAALAPALTDDKYTHIILDLKISARNGLELLSSTNPNNQKCNVILISGHGGRVLQSATRAARARGFSITAVLEKPFSMATLESAIQQEATPRTGLSSDSKVGALEATLPLTAEDGMAALEKGEIAPFFQPKVNLKNGKLVGYEALVRWNHPDFGTLPPSHFISLFSTANLEPPLSISIANQCIGVIEQLKERALKIAFNATPQALADRTMQEFLLSNANKRPHITKTLQIEVLESGFRQLSDFEIDALLNLKLGGFELIMDDYGAGWSSALRILEVPFSEIKIDRDLIKDVTLSSEACTLVEAAVESAHKLGITVTAEGVENPDTMEKVRALGCDQAQGYAIAHPMTIEKALDWRHIN